MQQGIKFSLAISLKSLPIYLLIATLLLFTSPQVQSKNEVMSSSRGRSGSFMYHSVPSPSTPSNNSMSSASEDDFSAPSPKRGRKESEQRRRVMMNQYFDELITLLSMVSERNIPKKMDKATTLKEAMTCIRVYYDLTKTSHSADKCQQPKTPKSSKTSKSKASVQTSESTMGDSDGPSLGFKPGFLMAGETLQFFLDAHDSFLIVISESGRILYSTELITSLLGHMQTRLVGQNIFSYVHDDDQDIVQQIFKPVDPNLGVPLPDTPITAYPSRRFNCHLKLYSGESSGSPQYLPFICLSYLRQWNDSSDTPNSSQPPSPVDPELASIPGNNHQACVLLLGKLPTSLSLIDLSVGTNDVGFEFTMRVSRVGRIIDIDKHALLLFGYSSSELIGSSFFDLVNPYHIVEVGEAMSVFLNTGLGTSQPYRFRTKGGRYIWLISKGYLSYNPWNHKPDHLLLTSRVLGCDQVFPEHRFFRNKKLLPDLEGSECYNPPPLQPPSGPPTTSCELNPPTPLTTNTTPSFQPPPFRSQPPHVQPPHIQLPNVQPPHIQPPASQLHPTQMNSMPMATGITVTTAPNTAVSSQQGNQQVVDMQKELERKTQELFEMQQRLIEQQQQFERERNQLFNVTQQMMQQMGSSVSTMLPSSLQQAATNVQHQSQLQMSISNLIGQHPAPSPSPAGPHTPTPVSSPAMHSNWGSQQSLLGSGFASPFSVPQARQQETLPQTHQPHTIPQARTMSQTHPSHAMLQTHSMPQTHQQNSMLQAYQQHTMPQTPRQHMVQTPHLPTAQTPSPLQQNPTTSFHSTSHSLTTTASPQIPFSAYTATSDRSFHLPSLPSTLSMSLPSSCSSSTPTYSSQPGYNAQFYQHHAITQPTQCGNVGQQHLGDHNLQTLLAAASGTVPSNFGLPISYTQ